MNKVVILSGLPGAGKSYYASTFRNAWGMRRCEVVSTDHYWGPSYDFKSELLEQAHQHCFRNYLHALERKVPLIFVDNTNLSRVEIAPYHLAGTSLGYEVVIHRVLAPPSICWERQVHGVPREKFDQMVETFLSEQRFFPPWWKVEEV